MGARFRDSLDSLFTGALGVLFFTLAFRPPPAPPSASRPVRVSEPAPAPPAPLPPARAEGLPRTLGLPLPGLDPRTLRDTFYEARGRSRRHEALDIPAPRGTRVLAVDEGIVRKLFKSVPGGITVYQFSRDETLCYYYAHLESYAPGLAEGDHLKPGDLIGYVGTTGNAAGGAPHLHFAVFELGPEKRWWEGKPIDPYPLLMPQRATS